MCGISGEIRFDGAETDIASISAISRRMHRRGEDGEGFIAFDNISLGHRRLKIFDLSAKAQQPMFDPGLGIGITFNGAIYNYRKLRSALKAQGYIFFSTSDTEVLLKAYHCWGLDMLPRLHGIFAFAIWERDSGKLILARDRMGVKPLYYVHMPSYFRFASTLPALLTPDIDKSIDDVALHYYLTFHAIPEPFTLIKNIRKLEPGTVMTIDNAGAVKKHTYWKMLFSSGEKDYYLTEREWLEQLETLLTQSIRKRLTADVPVGILLSGGLDSSLIVALIADTMNNPPQTFSIGFESTPQEQGDEFYYSDLVARHFSTAHHKLFVKTPELREALMESVASMSEPMPSHDVIAFYLLSKEVAKHVKVVQSGQGADELFAGYHWFQDMDYHNISARVAARKLCGRIADNSYEEYLKIVMPEHRTPNLALAYMEQLCSENGSSYMLDQLQQYEATCALTNGPLARVDNMTMAWGLEAREPFLDHKLAELASHMPAKYKVRKGGKYLLKKLGQKLLPKEIIDRPKGYFPVPKLKHLGTKEVGWLQQEVLSSERVKQRGLFDPAYIKELLNTPDSCTPLGASKLWQIGVLEYWLQTHNIH